VDHISHSIDDGTLCINICFNDKTLFSLRFACDISIGVLVFREGLECILVLAAVTASLRGTEGKYQRPVSAGAGIGFVAPLLTWTVAVRIVDHIGEDLSTLAVQAAPPSIIDGTWTPPAIKQVG
jgi:hypothetical protein